MHRFTNKLSWYKMKISNLKITPGNGKVSRVGDWKKKIISSHQGEKSEIRIILNSSDNSFKQLHFDNKNNLTESS